MCSGRRLGGVLSNSRADRILTLGIGETKIAQAPACLAIFGLGSCVAVFLHEARSRIGALGHALLPGGRTGGESNSGRYVAHAVRRMVSELEEAGAPRRGLRAKIVGGASVLPTASRLEARSGGGAARIGARNVEAALATLREEGVELIAVDIGGFQGRSLVVDLDDGRIRIRTGGADEIIL